MDIHNLTNSLVKKYNTRNPFDILKCKNAIVLFVPLDGVRGFYQYFQRNNIIYINEALSDREKMFVCAHELGHMLMHKRSNAVYMDSKTLLNTDKYELDANLFAANLLISDECIMENKDLTVQQLARLLGYEKSIVELRLSHRQ